MKQIKETRKTNVKTIFLLPIIIVLGFVPVIVHMHQYDAGMEKFDWFPDSSNTRVDLFMAYKSYAIMLLAGIILFVLIIQAIKKKEEFRMETSFYFLLIYAIFGKRIVSGRSPNKTGILARDARHASILL